MNKLTDFLKNPAPLYDKPWQVVLLCSAISAAILAIFEPFAFRLDSMLQFLMLLGFVVLTFLSSTLFFVLLPLFFRSYFSQQGWTNGRMFIHIGCFFLFSGILIFLYEYVWLGKHSADEYWTKNFFVVFGIDLLSAITIGLIPVTIYLFMVKNRRLKENLYDANELNAVLSQRLHTEVQSGLLVLEGNNKESFSVDPDSVLYIESEGNYVGIVYHGKDRTYKKMLRSTIKQVEEMLKSESGFVRCHRAFIVNVNHILNVSGNAQGYKLSLRFTDEIIPVSRTYNKLLKDSLR